MKWARYYTYKHIVIKKMFTLFVGLKKKQNKGDQSETGVIVRLCVQWPLRKKSSGLTYSTGEKNKLILTHSKDMVLQNIRLQNIDMGSSFSYKVYMW